MKSTAPVNSPARSSNTVWRIPTASSLKQGRYRHYKGRDYIVSGVATHSESEEELVVYRKDYGDGSLWVRPLNMFTETVEVDGVATPRFKYLGEEASDAPAD